MKGSTTLSKGGRQDVCRYTWKGILKVKDSFGKYVLSLWILFVFSFPYTTNDPNETVAIFNVFTYQDSFHLQLDTH